MRGRWWERRCGELVRGEGGEGRTYLVVAEALPPTLLSHSIFATAISAVSLSERFSCVRYGLRIAREEGSEIAPIASAACTIRSAPEHG